MRQRARHCRCRPCAAFKYMLFRKSPPFSLAEWLAYHCLKEAPYRKYRVGLQALDLLIAILPSVVEEGWWCTQAGNGER